MAHYNQVKIPLASACLSMLVGCGQDAAVQPSEVEENTRSQEVQNELSVVDHEMNKNNSYDLNGFAGSYQISIDGCDSGYANSIDEMTGELNVYTGDKNCVAKLISFTYLGSTFIPSDFAPFSSYKVGDTAVYVDEFDSSSNIHVSISETLNNPINASGERIIFEFSDVEPVLNNQNISFQNSSINFSISNTSFVGISSEGSGQFQFALECSGDLDGTFCDETNLFDLSYAVVDSSQFESGFTIENASAIDESYFFPVDSSNLFEDGEFNSTSGGFLTSVLQTPGNMASSSNFVLLVKSNSGSFQYFNINLPTI